jgi:membrane carboxypeptidase/penicillin-binding protein
MYALFEWPALVPAREAVFKSVLEPYQSLALGSCAVTPLEMACAYGTLATYM